MRSPYQTISLALLASLALACGGDPELVEHYVVHGKADGGVKPAVQLIYAESWNHQKYGMSDLAKRFVVRVENLAYHKRVAIHHSTTTGEWVDLEASYVGTAGSTGEYWEARTSAKNFGGQFVVRYATAGAIYWDNNNGNDYRIGDADGPMLGVGINVRLNAGHVTDFSGGIRSFWGIIDVRNLAYDKGITVHYSVDGWKSEKTVEATFIGSYRVYGYSSVPNPNALGIEGWHFEIHDHAPQIEYYVSYEVGGQTYGDNDYGRNYRLGPAPQ